MPPPSQDVREAIARAVRSGRFTSQRAVLQEIRSQGLRISNKSGRALINENRIAIKRGDELINQYVDRILEPLDEALRGTQFKSEFVEFTYRESDLKGKPVKVVEDVLRENVRNREVFVLEKGRNNRLSDFTHTRVTFSAQGTITYYIEGRQYGSETRRINGQFTTAVEAFTENLLADKVRTQVEGQLINEFGQRTGLGTGSVIKGLSAEVTNLIISITEIRGRGSRAGGFGSQSRGEKLGNISLNA